VPASFECQISKWNLHLHEPRRPRCPIWAVEQGSPKPETESRGRAQSSIFYHTLQTLPVAFTIGLVDRFKDMTDWLAQGEASASQGYLTSAGGPLHRPSREWYGQVMPGSWAPNIDGDGVGAAGLPDDVQADRVPFCRVAFE